MPNFNSTLCACGSDLQSYWERDARGIPLCKVCLKCRDDKLSKFRAEVLTDSNYECSEDVDADETYDEFDDFEDWDDEDDWDDDGELGDRE